MSTEQIVPTRSAKEQFDKQATHYNAQWSTWSEETLAWLLVNAHCRTTDQVLDVATGTGFTALAFAPSVHSVVGMDVSTGMLAEARRRAEELGLTDVTFVEGAAEALPAADASFDLVTCRIAPHHFLDIQQFVREVVRVLKPGGRFLLADTSVPDDPEIDLWQNQAESLRDPSHVRNYTAREWTQLVASAGLTLEIVSDSGGGITIPLSEWLHKAGCTSDQSEAVRRHFNAAPESAQRAFRLEERDGDLFFTWQRVLLKSVKSPSS